MAMVAPDAAEAPSSRFEISTAGAAAIPVVYADMVGLYQPPHPAHGLSDTAVLLLSPWGFEEICTRKFWRVMAEAFAAKGMASLRFDYPGTGDCREIAAEAWQPGRWRCSVVESARLLRDLSGCENVILVGQGLGAALAYEASSTMDKVKGLALLAPVLDGRSYLRELSVWTRMSEPLTASLAPDHLVLGGEVIPKPVTDDIRGLKLKARQMGTSVFLAPREDQAAVAGLGAELQALGVAVETRVYDEYPALVSNLTLQRMPEDLLANLVSWAKKLAGEATRARPGQRVAMPEACLQGPHFIETHLRMEDGRLRGILCEPQRKAVDAAGVILLNPSYEKAAGWGRSVAALARDLAGKGIASLRFDMANVGDSVPRDGAPAQVLYTESQLADVRAAIDVMRQRCPGPLIAAGRCSGAYLAFRALLQDDRLSGAVVGNAYTLEWDPDQNLEDLLLFVPQRLSSYTTKILTVHSWRKILSGEVNLRHGLRNIGGRLLHKATAALKPWAKRFGIALGRPQGIQEAVASISERGAQLSLVYTEGDIGLDYVRRRFETGENGLAGLPDVRFTLIAGGEHNMLTPAARAALASEIILMAKQVGSDHKDRGDPREGCVMLGSSPVEEQRV